MNRLLLALMLALALGHVAMAASNQTKITGDTFVIDEANGTATFSGNVVVERTGLTVWAAKVLIEYGAGGPEDVRTFTATGRVRIKTPDQDATGDRAVFDPANNLLRMTGNVEVVNATGTLNGPELIVNLNDNSTTFRGGSGGRVTGVFSTQ